MRVFPVFRPIKLVVAVEPSGVYGASFKDISRGSSILVHRRAKIRS